MHVVWYLFSWFITVLKRKNLIVFLEGYSLLVTLFLVPWTLLGTSVCLLVPWLRLRGSHPVLASPLSNCWNALRTAASSLRGRRTTADSVSSRPSLRPILLLIGPSPRRPHYALQPVRPSVCLSVSCLCRLLKVPTRHCADVLFKVNGIDLEGRISCRC